MIQVKLIPILGRKTSVPADDASMFKWLSQGVAMTHDAGGVNFDLDSKKNACSKSLGKAEWSNSATAQATRTMGMFELYDGTNREHIICDNGKIYYYDGSNDPVDISAGVTFANSLGDIYSFARVGEYMIFADYAEHTPYKWKSGDANVSKLIASGTEYKFRYLAPFQRRVFGLYSDQTDGDIDVRWSTSWPGTAITSLNYPAANQLYVPNDDPIVGGGTMGNDRLYVYCEDSIQQIVYLQDFETPFRIYTIVPNQGAGSHHSIINLGNRHLLFNKHYGFCEYRGGAQFPFGGRSLSEPIENLLKEINPDYYNQIVGKAIPMTNQVVWTVPLRGGTEPTHLLFYDYVNDNWTVENKAARYLDYWRIYSSFTWNDLIAELGGAGATWEDAGTKSWAEYTSLQGRLVFSNADGVAYSRTGTTDNTGNLDGYRIEPIIDFGDKKRKDVLQGLWLDVATAGNYSIDFYWRGGQTAGEVEQASWEFLGSISANSPSNPSIRSFSKSARLHQIKWGTDLKQEPFVVNGITLIAQTQSEY